MASMTKAQMAARIAELEAMAEKGKPAQKEPGFKVVEHDAKYELWKAERVLDDGSVIHWFIKPGKKGELWIDFQCNLRFGKKGGPIPGIGGNRERWNQYDKYFGGDYRKDRKVVIDAIKSLSK